MLLRFAAALAALTVATTAHAAPAPPKATPEQVTLASPTGPLQGTLVIAKPKAPAILIIAGSGPTDRDGNSGLGVSAQPYRLLADGLAARGISTLRYDKRGVGGSGLSMRAEADMRFTTYSDDARLWAAELKKRAGVRCVWLAGHSEGALVAEIAALDNKDVCGVILISGAGRRITDVLREQFQNVPEAMRTHAAPAFDAWDAGKTVDCPPDVQFICRASVQPYMISWAAYDPATVLKSVPGRVLILHGSTDVQVTTADADRLAAARKDARHIEIPGMNHVLKVAPAERAANLATYRDAALPLAPGVVDAIVKFVRP